MGSDKSLRVIEERSEIKKSALRWLVQTLIFTAIYGASLFFSYGDLDWKMAWFYLGLFILSQLIVGIFLVPKNPELVAERTQIKASSEAQWDRPLVGTATVWGPVIMLVIAGLDHRWGWTLLVPDAIQFSALGIAALGSLVTIWAMVSNRFFYGRVRIEKDRGHSVASQGPYQSIRHPGYAGAIIFNLSVPLLLGSLWAFIPATVIILALILRTALEDRMLINGLEGYQEYTQRVRHRLLPGIW